MLEAKLEGKRWPMSSTREHEQQVQLCCKSALFDHLVKLCGLCAGSHGFSGFKAFQKYGLGAGLTPASISQKGDASTQK